MIGQSINNYILERKLGEGGMGTVYFARHNRIDRVVAIKVLHQNLFSNESIRTRFKNEANALIKLTHTCIVKIFDYVEQENFACLIMEYVDGITLDDYIMKVTGPLPSPRASSIISQVLDAVQYAHEKNVLHRDIKPGNIMVSRDGKMVRVMDFGIAKFTDEVNLKATHANAQLGTPFYMSPEQVKGMGYSASSDIYSLGVTLYEMVTGKCPYQEITNLFELQSKIVNEPLPPTLKYYPHVSPVIQEAIKIATAKDPAQRFTSSLAFKKYLEKTEPVPQEPVPEPMQSVPAPLAQTTPDVLLFPQTKPVRTPRKAHKRTGPVIVVIILIIISVGVLAYFSLHQKFAEPQQPSPAVAIIPPPDTARQSTPAKNIPVPLQPMPKIDTAVTIKATSKTPSVQQKETASKVVDHKTVIAPPSLEKTENTPATTTPPAPAPGYNVKEDLLDYLKGKKTFCGIPYDNINEITITNIGDKQYYEDSGNTSFLVELTINNIKRRCQVTYPMTGKFHVNPL